MAERIRYNSKRAFRSGKSALIFNHIPKCAGSTFKRLLYTNFGPAYKNMIFLEHWLELKAEIEKGFLYHEQVVLAGHATWGAEEFLEEDRDIYYITVLRHPLGLFRSHYTYAQVRGYSSSCSVEEFAEQYDPNPMVEWLGGGNLDRAKQELFRKYYYFGVVEEFDTFLQTLGNCFNFSFVDYAIVNVSGDRECEILPENASRVLERNGLDMQLYEWALHEFRRRTKILSRKSVCSARKARGFLVSDSYAKKTKNDEEVRSIESGDSWQQMVRSMEQSPYIDELVCLAIAECYEQHDADTKAEQWFKEAAARSISLTINLADFYVRRGSTKAQKVLQDAIARVERIATKANSFCNRELEKLRKCYDLIEKNDRAV